METLRIGFFCWESLRSVRIGGLAAAATCLAENLAKDHELHFFTLGTGEKKSEEIENVTYHYCHPAGDSIVDYCKNMGILMAQDCSKLEKERSFDILHFHDWHPTEALHILQDRPTVLTLHSTEYGRNGNAFGDWWEFKEISNKEWYSSLICKKATTVSRTLKREVMWLYNIPEWKLDVVPNGIHPEKYYMDVDPDEVKKEYGMDPQDPLVFYMGRLVRQKGPDMLLDSIPGILKDHKNARFLFAGDGDMRSYLIAKASTMNAVKFLGYLPDRELVRLLNASDLVAIPSRNEPFGLVLLEAWSAKKGVVATEVGGLSENIDNFENGIKVYTTPQSIAWGINYVMDSNSDSKKMGKRGREKVERNFKWKKIADCMGKTYSKMDY